MGGISTRKYRVHIYKVEAVAVIDVDAKNNVEAREKAISIAKNKKDQFKKPKSDLIAETFLVGW